MTRERANEGWEDVYRSLGVVQTKPLQKVVNFIPRLASSGCRRVLDLGCGTGRHAALLLEAGFEVTFADISTTGLDLLASLLTRIGSQAFSIVQLDMQEINFPEGAFDACIATQVIDHATEAGLKRVVDGVYKSLAEGGVFLTDIMSTQDMTFGKGTRVEAKTFRNSFDDEPGLLHYYAEAEDVSSIFKQFTSVEAEVVSNVYGEERGAPHTVVSWDVLATK